MDKKSIETPLLDAFIRYSEEGITSFDVPGHHRGNIDNKLTDYIGKKVFQCDMNAPYGLDNLAHPKAVIKESEKLMAEYCHADYAFFLINGTSCGLQAAITALCRPMDRIILPRNVHKSISNALVVSGAVPVYVSPTLDTNLEIANQPTLEDYKKAIAKYPSAKAVIVINPTYFGCIAPLKEIVDYAHSKNIAVIVDEAHGAHYYFSSIGPISAMDAGADIASVSFHKTAGSLTQSSILLLKGERISANKIQETLNITTTTSPNYLLLSSLDAARGYLEEHGEEDYQRVLDLAVYAREEINKIPGFIVRGKDYFLATKEFDYDNTKLLIEIDRLDINGFDLYRILNKEYKIQIELAESYVFLCVLALGNNKKHIDTLVKALKKISKEHFNKKMSYPSHSFAFDYGYMLLRPRTAFFAPGKKVLLEEALNHIAKESIIMYPPGIPMIQPGEIFNKEIIAQIKDGLSKNCTLLSTYTNAEYIEIIDEEKWKRFPTYCKKLEDYTKNHLTNPRQDSFTLNFEGDEHDGTLILLPYRKDVWRSHGKKAMVTFKEIITAIARYEKVYVGVFPSIYRSNISWLKDINNVVPFKIKYNDAWARDNSLVFVTNKEKQESRAVDFRFNAWGGDFDGLYNNYQYDDELGEKLAKRFGIKSYQLKHFILEGGSIASDGEGTLIVTEACLLSKGRNPQYNKAEIEEILKVNLGVSEVIWIPHGIIGDETNEHIDNMVAFSRPGEVLLAWPQSSDISQHSSSSKALKILENARDAKGRKLHIIKVKLPSPLYLSKKEAHDIKEDRYGAKPRLAGDSLLPSYINFYQGQKYVILPSFGVKEDEIALQQFKEIFPEKEIIQIASREILIGGGNIHCVTAQIPKGAIKKDEN